MSFNLSDMTTADSIFENVLGTEQSPDTETGNENSPLQTLESDGEPDV